MFLREKERRNSGPHRNKDKDNMGWSGWEEFRNLTPNDKTNCRPDCVRVSANMVRELDEGVAGWMAGNPVLASMDCGKYIEGLSYAGMVKNGVVVLPPGVKLAQGTKVVVRRCKTHLSWSSHIARKEPRWVSWCAGLASVAARSVVNRVARCIA